MKYLYKGQIVTANSKEEAKKIVADTGDFSSLEKSKMHDIRFYCDDIHKGLAKCEGDDYLLRYIKAQNKVILDGFGKTNVYLPVKSFADLKKVAHTCEKMQEVWDAKIKSDIKYDKQLDNLFSKIK